MKSVCRQKMFLPQNSMTCHYLWWPIYPESWILKFLTFKTTRYNDMMFVEYTCHTVDILLWIRISIIIRMSGLKHLYNIDKCNMHCQIRRKSKWEINFAFIAVTYGYNISYEVCFSQVCDWMRLYLKRLILIQLKKWILVIDQNVTSFRNCEYISLSGNIGKLRLLYSVCRSCYKT